MRRTGPVTARPASSRRRYRRPTRPLAGPAAPLRDQIVSLIDSSWLLRGRLSGGAELTYRGRPARQLRVTPAPGGEGLALGPLMTFPADALVDAETGCLLRLISYA